MDLGLQVATQGGDDNLMFDTKCQTEWTSIEKPYSKYTVLYYYIS